MRGNPADIAALPKEMSPHQDAKGMSRSEADGTHGVDPMAGSFEAGEKMGVPSANSMSCQDGKPRKAKG